LAEILTIGDRDVFLAVDLQNDFCPGGNLAVPRGNEVVPLINRLATKFQHVVLTQDWHPRDHQSFASSHGSSILRQSMLAMARRSCGPTTACNKPLALLFTTSCTFPMPSWCCAKVIIARSILIRRSTKTIAKRRPN
jgi:nicotinamidase-related amidase